MITLAVTGSSEFIDALIARERAWARQGRPAHRFEPDTDGPFSYCTVCGSLSDGIQHIRRAS
jgi:hypothetical protein